ncbi:hypothetical protein BTM25_46100 [Actinomadura rubteroloni]|uniref:Guanylate cyclase domain-containing protein n=1 Tax=Actinomadura rubteroloni TaxID=1926885 RepID=A0A2P4UEG8_9ACTN|nr:hypothetical protein [Actinomadura rubteroloni]POM23457.1 hypothetical protein BTM25_46100 [Actinomadura rubteroloni]
MTALAEVPELAYGFVVGVDIERFSLLNAEGQRAAQGALGTALDEAARRAGLERDRWHRQVGGDGELAFPPGRTDGVLLVGRYPAELARALTRVNRTRRGRPPLRVRMVVHHGTRAPGAFGPVGSAPILAARLLDSDALRARLRTGPGDLAFMVSERVFADVVQTGFGGLDPTAFERVVAATKSGPLTGYVARRLPGPPRGGGLFRRRMPRE